MAIQIQSIIANIHFDRVTDFNFGSRMNRNRGRGSDSGRVRGGRSTPNYRRASVWRPRESPLQHDAESLPSDRQGQGTEAHEIKEHVAGIPPLKNPDIHDDSPQSPMQLTPDRSTGHPSSLSDSRSQQKNSASSCLSLKERSPLSSSFGAYENNGIHVIDSLVPQGHSSCPPGYTTTRSAPGANCWQQQQEFPRSYITTSYSCERQGKEKLTDGISGKVTSMTLSDNPHKHDASPQSTSSHPGTLEQVKAHNSMDQPFFVSSSGSRHMDSPSSSLSGKVPSPDQAGTDVFDICQKNNSNTFKLQPSLLEKNREKRKEIKGSMDGQNIKILSDGMLLLKSFIPLMDQVRLVETCRELGIGPGGFYQPGYRDGAKLSLKMMCLGKNWDPQTSSYSDQRPSDRSKPPAVPDEFCELVNNALSQARSFLTKQVNCKNIDDVLPLMKPDICIVNFYTASGHLGLHQDKDETQSSLNRGLPVVSFSIGDTAEFLYGSEKDSDSANKVLLESGDVLIFGGKSRLIYHGVSSIKMGTASSHLSVKSLLKPGRLNLTFRQY